MLIPKDSLKSLNRLTAEILSIDVKITDRKCARCGGSFFFHTHPDYQSCSEIRCGGCGQSIFIAHEEPLETSPNMKVVLNEK